MNYIEKINSISKDWENGLEYVGSEINNRLGKLSSFLPSHEEKYPNFLDFQKHLMYVILDFLKNENTSDKPDELFIRIPIEELSPIEQEQVKLYNKCQGTIAACLSLSTIDKFYHTIKIPENSGYKNEGANPDLVYDWYEIGDLFLEPNKMEVWECRESNIQGVGRLYHENKKSTIFMKLEDFETKYKKSFFRINRKTRINEIVKEIESIEKAYKLENKPFQYNNAAFIRSYDVANDNFKAVNATAFDKYNTVKYFDNINEINRSNVGNIDIVVVCGDKNIGDLTYFKHRPHKKIIYIATNTPATNIPTYSFSIREMYHYCCIMRNNQKTPKFELPIVIKGIDFPWYNERKKELESLLSELVANDYLEEENKKNIEKIFRYMVLSMNFSKNVLENQVKEDYWIDDFCYGEAKSKIKEWLNSLVYQDDTNPKKIESDRYKKKFNRTITELVRHTRFKRNINAAADKAFYAIIDAASYDKNDSKRNRAMYGAYEYILQRCFFAKVTTLYYKEEESLYNLLMKYIFNELSLENSKIRKKMGTALTDKKDEIEDSNTLWENIKNSIKYETLFDDYEPNNSFFPTYCQEQISVEFKDGAIVNLTGDVLEVKNDNTFKRTSIDSYDENDIKTQDIKIKYYYPKDFEKITTAYWGNVIEKYSNLWKCRLREYIDNQPGAIKDEIEIIERQIKIDNLYRYYNNYDCLFPKCIQKISAFLLKKEYLTEEEHTNILTAQKCANKNSNISRSIKDEIFIYIEENRKNGDLNNLDMLQQIIDKNENLTIDDIIKDTIHDGVIKDITIN